MESTVAMLTMCLSVVPNQVYPSNFFKCCFKNVKHMTPTQNLSAALKLKNCTFLAISYSGATLLISSLQIMYSISFWYLSQFNWWTPERTHAFIMLCQPKSREDEDMYYRNWCEVWKYWLQQFSRNRVHKNLIP